MSQHNKEAKETYRRRFFQDFPVGKSLEVALKDIANSTPLFHFSKSTDPDLRGCWWVLGRLGPAMEKQFSVTGEVVFLFSPYEDLQRRSFNALAERIRGEVAQHQIETYGIERFTPDPTVAFLYAPDPRWAEKIDVWNVDGPGSLVVALPRTVNPQGYREELAERIFSVLSARDLYRGRNPVTGNDFFGRQATLRALRAELVAGRSVGLFGLRRSGKTSVVNEFRRRYRAQEIVVITSDLESVSALEEVGAQIGSDLTNALRELRDRDADVWIGAPKEQEVSGYSELSTRLVRAAERNSSYHFVVALDEIESLVPLIRDDPREVRHFLGALRRAAQFTPNVSLLLTGVTTRFFEDSLLDEASQTENPLFGFVESYFLPPFKPEETVNLVKKLGRSMMLRWEDDALDRLHTVTGGFPFLVRDLASKVRQAALRSRGDVVGTVEVQVQVDMVDSALAAWQESASNLWNKIVGTLEIHHPIMAEMVRCESELNLNEWLELGTDAHTAARNLAELGLLERAGDSWCRTPELRAMQDLSDEATSRYEAMQEAQTARAEDRNLVNSLAAAGEGKTLEYKSTAVMNLATGERDKQMMKAVVKTIAAFLNTDGGKLLIGIADNGEVCGVEIDLRFFMNDVDKYELHLRDTLWGQLDGAAHDRVQVRFVTFDDKTVCLIAVDSNEQPVWYKDGDADVLFVRMGNQTRKLPNRELVDYVGRHFSPE